jgi:hypothetical protein
MFHKTVFYKQVLDFHRLSKFYFNDTISWEEHKTTYGGLRITGMALSTQSDFTWNPNLGIVNGFLLLSWDCVIKIVLLACIEWADSRPPFEYQDKKYLLFIIGIEIFKTILMSNFSVR